MKLGAIAAFCICLVVAPALADDHLQPTTSASAYAEEVIDVSIGSPGPDRGGFLPESAVGAPDYDGDDDSETYVTLGCLGSIVLRLGGGGVVDREGPDLRTYEIGATSAASFEDHSIEISSDLQSWYAVGVSRGGTSEIDIAEGAPAGRVYQFVRITDLGELCSGEWAGADIDAVEVINTGIVAARGPDPYADSVVGWTVGAPGASEGPSQPQFALGPPDYTDSYLEPTIATLGCGGQITLRFTDNDLVDGEGADLRVFEPGDREAYGVEISVDGTDWRMVGQAGGGMADFDVSAVAAENERFHFVRITDARGLCEGVRPGADVDAVEALNSSTDTAQTAAAEGPDGNIAPDSDLHAGLTDGAVSTVPGDCVNDGPFGAGLNPGEFILARFDKVAEITGVEVFMGEEGSGETAGGAFDYPWDGTYKHLAFLRDIGAQGRRVDFDPAIRTKSIRFTMASGGGADSNICVSEFRIFGRLEDAAHESASETGAIKVAITELRSESGPGQGFTGAPLDAFVNVTNTSKARLYDPWVELTISGEAETSDAVLKAGPGDPRRDADAAFFDIECEVEKDAVSCPLGYEDRSEAGQPYLEPGEERSIMVQLTLMEPGAATFTAKAGAVDRADTEVQAEASRSAVIVGPKLGFRLLGTTPEPYGYTSNPRLPLHDGDEITFHFALRNSGRGGAAKDIDLSLYTEAGDVLSVDLSGDALPCTPSVSGNKRHINCALPPMDPNTTTRFDVSVHYEGRLNLIAIVTASNAIAQQSYQLGTEVEPFVNPKFFPPAPSTISPGQEIAARFQIRNRGRDAVEGAEFGLSVEKSDFARIEIDRVEGCRSLEQQADRMGCTLAPFSRQDVQEVAVYFKPVPNAAEADRVGFSWNLVVPGHNIPRISSGNEKGVVIYGVSSRLADLFVEPMTAANDVEGGAALSGDVIVGNRGTWAEEAAALKLRLNVFDESGAKLVGTYLARVTAQVPVGEAGDETREVPCQIAGNDAVCALGRLSPWQNAYVFFEWNSAGVAKGTYTYSAYVSEGQGESGRAELTKDNAFEMGGAIETTEKALADLSVALNQAIPEGAAGAAGSHVFALRVHNRGTIAEAAVGLKLVFDVSGERASPERLQHLERVIALVNRTGAGGLGVTSAVDCVIVANTASCPLGRLAPTDRAFVTVRWRAAGVRTGAYSIRAFVTEGEGEAAFETLADNRLTAGGAIVSSRPTP